ncbi:MAG: UDP-N-acetylglucosamine 1-carboxyvinyltransferase [Peptococcaceae bacterium]|nr:UDP-N-acetylglucosamine 1-carboxyvinyltransferase [Peptococcaceae bacterium]
MSCFIIRGGKKLSGTVKVSPAKNAVLPIIAASLLAKTPCFLEEVPDLSDVRTICSVIEYLGAGVEKENGGLKISVPGVERNEAPYEFVRKMRASILIMGPLLARTGRARISAPGGCAIGSRPIDLHLKGFCLLGADIRQGQGFIDARADKLAGSRIYLDYPSVGATENIMMAASLARGTTVIENAAGEPEVVDLANFLNSMGARIKGAGTRVIRVEGVDELHGASYSVIPDRIEAGTFMVAAAMAGGSVLVENVICDHVNPLLAKLHEAGVRVEEGEGCVRVTGDGRIRPTDIKTMPYPGFPTDMQPQFTAMMTLAGGTSVITETVFENRFMHVNELKRMGARIKVSGRTVIVQGAGRLSGARVKATDLRAGAALVLAGLAAEGVTEVGNIHHIDRGYENFAEKLRGLGADIERRD